MKTTSFDKCYFEDVVFSCVLIDGVIDACVSIFLIITDINSNIAKF